MVAEDRSKLDPVEKKFKAKLDYENKRHNQAIEAIKKQMIKEYQRYFDQAMRQKNLQLATKYQGKIDSLKNDRMVKKNDIEQADNNFVIGTPKNPGVSTKIPIPVTIFAASSVGAKIYLNDKQIIANAYRIEPGIAKLEIKVGDIITVKQSHRFDIASFWLNCQNKDGQYLFCSSRKWRGYAPSNPNEWWKLPKKSQTRPAIKVKNSREYTDLVKKVANSVKGSVVSQPIASKVSTEDKTGGYLLYVITEKDLIPKASKK